MKLIAKPGMITKKELLYIVAQIKQGYQIQFINRLNYNMVDNYLNNLKIAYYVDNIDQIIWI